MSCWTFKANWDAKFGWPNFRWVTSPLRWVPRSATPRYSQVESLEQVTTWPGRSNSQNPGLVLLFFSSGMWGYMNKWYLIIENTICSNVMSWKLSHCKDNFYLKKQLKHQLLPRPHSPMHKRTMPVRRNIITTDWTGPVVITSSLSLGRGRDGSVILMSFIIIYIFSMFFLMRKIRFSQKTKYFNKINRQTHLQEQKIVTLRFSGIARNKHQITSKSVRWLSGDKWATLGASHGHPPFRSANSLLAMRPVKMEPQPLMVQLMR